MRKISLSPRLLKIVEMIKANERVSDIGTDHAYLPIYLIQHGIVKEAIVTDIKKGPLDRALSNAKLYGVYDKLTFFLCDGLDAVASYMTDTVIIAGMGGETIAEILNKAPWTKEKRLILQPMSNTYGLREFLQENGYAIIDEAIVKDANKFYFIIEASGGYMEKMSVTEKYIGTILDASLDPLFREYIKSLGVAAAMIAECLKTSSKPADAARLEEQTELSRGIRERLKGNGI